MKPKWQRNRDNGVPLEGDIAFSQGWDCPTANPHEQTTVAHVRWIADWWRANADAFDSHVNGMTEDLEDRGETIHR
jgi:hypothetical protein